MLNASVRICDKALSALYTVSVAVLSDMRIVPDTMYRDPSIEDCPVLQNGLAVSTKSRLHPGNRYPDNVRKQVETHLDMVLRADPGASDGTHTYQVYSPEINPCEKLRMSIATYLEGEDDIHVHLSSSTLHKMINNFLKSRKSRIKICSETTMHARHARLYNTFFRSSAATLSLQKLGRCMLKEAQL